ncbi:hypothetical protein RB195_011533 [Necator americanus]|uniref:Helitron helicase-like domain-containing protein n=1 Tax=Necator americanus TaxID=51031 RepID=A0ABR1D4W5_NECAM
MVNEVERAEEEAAIRDNRRPTTTRMVFEESRRRNIARGQRALPTANEEFAVDTYAKIEQNRLNYHKTHQVNLRSDSYRGLQNYLAGEHNYGPPRNRIVLASSHIDSPRAMQQSYQDVMAIVSRYLKPTYFLMITCNPQGHEIQENLYEGQVASDRPDLTARVFSGKLKELCNDLFKRRARGNRSGPDRAQITIESDSGGSGNHVVDEVKEHLNTRYVCPPQALHIVFGFAMQEKSHTVCRLAVHLPEYQTVCFVTGQEQQALDGTQSNFTTLTAYIELNRLCANVFDNGQLSDMNIDAREIFYCQIPEHFSITARHGNQEDVEGEK